MEIKNSFSKFINISKVFLVLLLVVGQIGLVLFLVGSLTDVSSYWYWCTQLAALIVVGRVVSSSHNISSKLSWAVLLMTLPALGIFFYFMLGQPKFVKKFKKKIDRAVTKNKLVLEQSAETAAEVEDSDAFAQINLLYRLAKAPVYKNTKSVYLPIGEVYFAKLLEELETAEKFIFLEYFIVSDGQMYRKLMDCLIAKAKQGVEILFLYDQAGSIGLLPKTFIAECTGAGIRVSPFSPLSWSFYSFISYRDHRKIAVIDGNKAFTGGINIGDEYINAYEKYGHWKDMGIFIEGDAVYSFTVMFLKMWSAVSGMEFDISHYAPTVKTVSSDEYVVPFEEGPSNFKNPAENNYMKIISLAKRYVYITTPYLIVDTDMQSSLLLAAKSGVDVRILTPHIPDKKFVFQITRAFYHELIRGGVKIYEYTPGFVHGKVMVADDKISTVGSINLDFRSLVWDYECAAWVYSESFAKSVREDYEKSLAVSQEMKPMAGMRRSMLKNIYTAFLKICSPLF